jgi:O-antigen/teichoic acid export membrane protein
MSGPSFEGPPEAEAAPTSEPSSREALRRRAVRGAVTVTSRGIVIRALGLAGTLVLARLLSPADFGILALGLALLSLSSFLAGTGLGAALVKQPASPTRTELGTLLAFQLLVTSALVLVALLVAAAIGSTGAWAVAVTVAAAPAIAVRAPVAVLLERELDYRPLAVAEIAETAVYQVVALALVVAGFGVVGVAVASIARGVTGSALLVRRRPGAIAAPSLDLPTLRRLTPFALRFQGPWAIETVRFNAFNAVVSTLASLGTLGLWSIAVRLLQPVLLVQQAVERVSFSATARAVQPSREPPRDLLPAARAGVLGLGLVLVPLTLVSIELIPLVLGDEWRGAGEALAWAGAGMLVSAPLHTMVYPFLYVSERAGIVLRTSAASAAVSLVGAAVGAPLLGIQGVGMAIAAAALAQVVVTHAMVRRAVGIRILPVLWAPLAVTVAAGAVGAGVVVAIAPVGAGTVAATLAALLTFALLTRLLAWDSVTFLRRQVAAARGRAG